MSQKFEFDKSSQDKSKVFQQSARILLSKGFRVIDLDITKPWGFYLSVDESQAPEFIKTFYSENELAGINTSLSLRPKFLGIAPKQRLSWQYHHRRSEKWKTLAGSYDLVMSMTDEEGQPRTINEDEVIDIGQGTRHRAVGRDQWALIAEIWQHTDQSNPSDEADIIRLQDDFGRK